MRTYPIKELKKVEEFKQAVMDNFGIQHYVLMLLLLNTGMSILEVLPLKWKQIMDGKEINNFIIFKGKKIYLGSRVIQSLISLRKMYPKNIYVFQTKHGPTVDVKSKPSYWHRNYIFFYLKEAGKQVGLDVSATSIRKTFVYHAIVTYGKNPYLLQNFLGHSSLKQTLDFADIPSENYLEDQLFKGLDL